MGYVRLGLQLERTWWVLFELGFGLITVNGRRWLG